MGINIGGLVGPLLTGAVQDAWGFHAGFALAAVGMALGLIQYTLGRKHLHGIGAEPGNPLPADKRALYIRSEEHTSELQSLMRISYAVFCLKKKNNNNYTKTQPTKI